MNEQDKKKQDLQRLLKEINDAIGHLTTEELIALAKKQNDGK